LDQEQLVLWARGESSNAAGRAVPDLAAVSIYKTASTSAAQTAAPTATCAAWSGCGSPSSTIDAATATCKATSATTHHAPRVFVRIAHHTTYPARVYANRRCVHCT